MWIFFRAYERPQGTKGHFMSKETHKKLSFKEYIEPIKNDKKALKDLRDNLQMLEYCEEIRLKYKLK